jgi:hypothetical protein
MSAPERIALQNKRTALQRSIYQWSIAQGEYMPHVKWARSQNDFTFSVIHGRPPPGDLMYVASGQGSISASSIQAVTTPMGASSTRPVNVSSSQHGNKRKRALNGQSDDTDPLLSSPVGPTDSLMDVDHVEDIRLILPSDIPYQYQSYVCSQHAIDAEFTLLKAELHDSLVNIRKYC